MGSLFLNFLVRWLNLEVFSFLRSFLRRLMCFKVWMNFLSFESFLHSSKTNSNLQLRIKFFLVSEAFLFLSSEDTLISVFPKITPQEDFLTQGFFLPLNL